VRDAALVQLIARNTWKTGARARDSEIRMKQSRGKSYMELDMDGLRNRETVHFYDTLA
jgi:hypothetical protein